MRERLFRRPKQEDPYTTMWSWLHPLVEPFLKKNDVYKDAGSAIFGDSANLHHVLVEVIERDRGWKGKLREPFMAKKYTSVRFFVTKDRREGGKADLTIFDFSFPFHGMRVYHTATEFVGITDDLKSYTEAKNLAAELGLDRPSEEDLDLFAYAVEVVRDSALEQRRRM